MVLSVGWKLNGKLSAAFSEALSRRNPTGFGTVTMRRSPAACATTATENRWGNAPALSMYELRCGHLPYSPIGDEQRSKSSADSWGVAWYG
jgi:hypothetical protein